ncbi:hypothetical protein [Providencia hangzhouensis]|uniref:Ankyrin repeat domain-containing protein n=1 Tax=Providencia hangzhouensis TaxID=3031799 RepID=A0ABY9Z5P7_9GAMM|nr:hypothetical protein [Providencia hangzhouensis]WNK22513.1 hypothetical protein PZ638_11095 [Providencia hangzhouensis]
MFDGLGYVVAIGAVVLITLCITYLISIGNAFNDTIPKDKTSECHSEKFLAKDDEENSFKSKFKNNSKVYKWRSLIIASVFIPFLNFIYYCDVEIYFVKDKGEIFFGIFTFFIFTFLNFFLVVFRFKKSSEFVGAFLISFVAYNIIYFPQKLNVDFENKIHSFIANGDTNSLEKELGKNCSLVEYELDDYIWYALFRSEAPIDSLEFLFGCQFHEDNFDVNRIEEGRHYLRSFFDKKISKNMTINHNLEALFAEKYFTLLDEESKQKLIWELVYKIATESKKEYSDIYISRLDKLIDLNPNIASYVNLRDIDYHKMIEYREVNAANYFLTRLPPSNDDYKLAMNILTNNLPFVIEKVKNDRGILENTIINDIDSYFYKSKNKKINLIFYAFYVGNAEMINYLIENKLFKIEDYNYEMKTAGSYEAGCNNYLVTGIAESWTLNEDEKKALLQKLKGLPNICDRMIEVELNKINEMLAKYKS